MKFKKSAALLAASTILLAGCTTDSKEIKAYNEQVEKAFDHESALSEQDKKMSKLEEEKAKINKKIQGKPVNEIGEDAKRIVDNAKERQSVFDKENKILNEARDIFKKANKHVSEIKNDDKQKELKEFDKAVEDKYKAYDDYRKAYQSVLDAEKDYFSYLAEGNVDENGMKEKSQKLSDAYKSFEKTVKAYKKALKKVASEKQDVDAL